MSGRVISCMTLLSHRQRRAAILSALLATAALLIAPNSIIQSSAQPASSAAQDNAKNNACVGDNGGITLPPGFCATVFADNLGHARHMAVGAERRALCQHLERPLLSQRHAAARRLSDRAQGHQRATAMPT